MITRGTTPTNTFELGIDLTKATVYVTYMQGNRILFTKTNKDLTITEDKITLRLSQEETLMFDPSVKVKMQVRYVFEDGRSDASEIMTTRVADILQEGSIEYVPTEDDSEDNPDDPGEGGDSEDPTEEPTDNSEGGD